MWHAHIDTYTTHIHVIHLQTHTHTHIHTQLTHSYGARQKPEPYA